MNDTTSITTSKTFEVIDAYIGNREIKAYVDNNIVLDIILNDYDIDGACEVLKAFGYRMLNNGG